MAASKQTGMAVKILLFPSGPSPFFPRPISRVRDLSIGQEASNSLMLSVRPSVRPSSDPSCVCCCPRSPRSFYPSRLARLCSLISSTRFFHHNSLTQSSRRGRKGRSEPFSFLLPLFFTLLAHQVARSLARPLPDSIMPNH